MIDSTPRSQKIPIENSPFSSATHLSALNFSIFTQKYHELRSQKPSDQQSLARKQWLKITRNYLRVERNNILFNFFVAKKIHHSRKEILQRHCLSEWRNRYIESKSQKEISNENVSEENNQITKREISIPKEENDLNATENSVPTSPHSPNSRKLIRKHYSDKSTDTVEIPKPTLVEKVKSINPKTVILSLIVVAIACIGTYYGFHFYFKHNKYEQLYKKHKYEATLPPHDNEDNDDVVIDYSKVFPEDGDLVYVVKNLIKKVKNIKSKQTEMNEQVQNIQESLDKEAEKEVGKEDEKEGANEDEKTSVTQTIQDSPSDKNESVELDSTTNNSSPSLSREIPKNEKSEEI